MKSDTITLVGVISTIWVLSLVVTGLIADWSFALFVFLIAFGVIGTVFVISVFWVWAGEKFGD